MGKFKVGDRVRRIGTFNCDDMRIGDTGTVTEVDSDGDCFVRSDKSGDSSFNFARYLELVTAAPAPWQPKVGDRVRFTDAVPSHWFFGPTKEHKEGVIRSDSEESGGFRFTVNVGNSYGYVNLGHIEPAPLIITADRYYKTRDGRKVGPLRTWPDLDGNPHPDRLCEAHGDGRYWLLDGKGVCAEDLIAEWVEEPATIANDNAAPAKFKVGDFVVATETFSDISEGKRYEIIEVDDGDVEMPVRVIDDVRDPYWLHVSKFSQATTQTPPAIVALIETGVAKPAFEPKVHASEADATVEAERLAGMYRGQRFGIFVLSDTREADIPTYNHEWKNFAARGEKIRAIKELRAITGMGLKPAKDAVEYFLAAA